MLSLDSTFAPSTLVLLSEAALKATVLLTVALVAAGWLRKSSAATRQTANLRDNPRGGAESAAAGMECVCPRQCLPALAAEVGGYGAAHD